MRYADDFIDGFEHEGEARRFLDEMRVRLAEFALSLHPEKTRLIEFGRFAADNRKRRGLGKPETFNFLGFTFICYKSRRGASSWSNARPGVTELRAKIKAVKKVHRRCMHLIDHEHRNADPDARSCDPLRLPRGAEWRAVAHSRRSGSVSAEHGGRFCVAAASATLILAAHGIVDPANGLPNRIA